MIVFFELEGCVLAVVTVRVVHLALACAMQEKLRPRASVFDLSNQWWASASAKIDRPQLCEWVSGCLFARCHINFPIYPSAAGSELVLLVLRLPLDGTSA